MSIINIKLLDKFIAKYHLGGSTNGVKWVVHDGVLQTATISEDKYVVGMVAINIDGFPDGEYGVFDTKLLQQILGSLQDDVVIEVEKHIVNNVPIALNFRNASGASKKKGKAFSVRFSLASLDIISTSPKLKQLPEFDVVLELDSDIISHFCNTKWASGMYNEITIESTPKLAKLYLGKSQKNSNSTTMQWEWDADTNGLHTRLTALDPLSIRSDYFWKILLANKDCSQGLISISSSGLIKIEFKPYDRFIQLNYYLTKLI